VQVEQHHAHTLQKEQIGVLQELLELVELVRVAFNQVPVYFVGVFLTVLYQPHALVVDLPLDLLVDGGEADDEVVRESQQRLPLQNNVLLVVRLETRSKQARQVDHLDGKRTAVNYIMFDCLQKLVSVKCAILRLRD